MEPIYMILIILVLYFIYDTYKKPIEVEKKRVAPIIKEAAESLPENKYRSLRDPKPRKRIDPYTGELTDKEPEQSSSEPSYDIMDRDILSKTGRDTVQGLYVHRSGTNETMWLSGGSL